MNGLVERQNRTLQDMVRNMISHYTLLKSLWGEALKTTTYILNRVQTKVVVKTPNDIWIGGKLNLKHLHVWGCPIEARPYRSHENKLKPKTVSNYFIGCAERSKGFNFYDPTLKNIFEMGTVTFYEDVEFGRRNKLRALTLRRNQFQFLLPSLLTMFRFPYLSLIRK